MSQEDIELEDKKHSFLEPPIWVAILVIVIAVAGLLASIFTFTRWSDSTSQLVQAVMWIVSVILLIAGGYYFIYLLFVMLTYLNSHNSRKYAIKRAMTDIHYRTVVIAFISFAFHIILAILQLVLALRQEEIQYWYLAFGIYHLIVAAVKLTIYFIEQNSVRKTGDIIKAGSYHDYRIYLVIGVISLILNLVIIFGVIPTVVMYESYDYINNSLTLTEIQAVGESVLLILGFIALKKTDSWATKGVKFLNLNVYLCTLFSLLVVLLSRFNVKSDVITTTALVVGIVLAVSILVISITNIVVAAQKKTDINEGVLAVNPDNRKAVVINIKVEPKVIDKKPVQKTENEPPNSKKEKKKKT
ncbi:MAG: hypothetical protein LUC16_01830 [Coprobacillus sp.]|nr:hypothetical protein [Coprobacillus sp.]